MSNRVLVVGGGAREQAIGSKLFDEGHEVFISPGNPGNEGFAESTGIQLTDIEYQLKFAKRNHIDLTIPSSEGQLAAGIVDLFQEEKLQIFGPTQEQAGIESDKAYAKQIAKKTGVPIGRYMEFDSSEEAVVYTRRNLQPWPVFVKDNDLAQGKGVTRCDSLLDFLEAVSGIDGKVVVEDCVDGPEASIHSFCDGKTQLTVPFLIRDHKELDGKMTGGMGTVAPLREYNHLEVKALGNIFAEPIVREIGFGGLLFSGLKGYKGEEKCLEWNARPGDPEMQVVSRMLQSGLLPILQGCVEGRLSEVSQPRWSNKSATCLVLAAHGYPDNPTKDMVIEGIEEAEKMGDVQVLHAATKYKNGNLVSNGGRVLNIVTLAETMVEAVGLAYEAAQKITFNEKAPLMRRDIGQTALGNRRSIFRRF